MGFRERVEAWEQAYRDYMAAWEHSRAVLSPVSATNTANVARRVSRAWHELAQARGLPWWCVAALESAAEGFADLAQEWERHDGNVGRAGAALDSRREYRGDGGGDRDGRASHPPVLVLAGGLCVVTLVPPEDQTAWTGCAVFLRRLRDHAEDLAALLEARAGRHDRAQG
jgi:hypothetical protein